jgi:hypothetical protein
VSVIDGFRIEMTADELAQHLNARIEHHRRAAADCEAKRDRLEAVAPPDAEPDDEAPMFACWPGYAMELERRGDRHKQSEAALAFLRDHVVAREIYRLGERDLKLLELWPRRVEAASEW